MSPMIQEKVTQTHLKAFAELNHNHSVLHNVQSCHVCNDDIDQHTLHRCCWYVAIVAQASNHERLLLVGAIWPMGRCGGVGGEA